jgi:lysophospholipase L1-like esterase
LAANQAWLDRHFLPLFFFPREKALAQETVIRTVCGLIGLVLALFVRPAISRATRRMSTGEIMGAGVRMLLAIVLALAVSEMLLARQFTYAAAEKVLGDEPQRRPDPLLGWSFVPNHHGRMIAGGREIASATDSHGYRVRGPRDFVDTGHPTILFTGESIITGYGLNWEETIPAQTSAMLDLQSANMAVSGYANDQAYLRLKNELPRFQRPVAVVSLFTPALFTRNLSDDRPYLGADLQWHPAIHRLRLSALLRYIVPYRSAADIEQGIAATRAVLTATAQLARRHHAVALVVDPQFGPEQPVESMLRRRILDEAGISYLRVPLDPAWRLKGDLHPSPQAARVIAASIARHLQTALNSSGLTNQ